MKDTEDALDFAMREFSVSSIVDAPCGDFNWMHRFLERHPALRYQGFDIVADLIRRNRERYAPYPFSFMDLTQASPPRADLILCKDLVNHLTNADVCRVLRHFKASGSEFLLLSNNKGWQNVELPLNVGGSSRHLDVTQPPFNLPQPVWDTHYLGLWRLDQLPDDIALSPAPQSALGSTSEDPSDYLAGGAVVRDSASRLEIFCREGVKGIVLFGPYVWAASGRYRAGFRITVPPDTPLGEDKPCARVEVTTESGKVVVSARAVSPLDLQRNPLVVLDFELESDDVLELRVHSYGWAALVVDYERPLVRL